MSDNSLIEVIEVDPYKLPQDPYYNMIEIIEEDPNKVPHVQICCLIDGGIRCTQTSGNASYSKRVQKTVQEKKLKLDQDATARHSYICDFHKGVIQSVRLKRKVKEPEPEVVAEPEHKPEAEMDFSKLQLNTLRRYKHFFKVPTKPNMNKAQLAEVMQNHFKTIPVDEKEILSFFIYTVKTNSNRLDNKAGTSAAGSSTNVTSAGANEG